MSVPRAKWAEQKHKYLEYIQKSGRKLASVTPVLVGVDTKSRSKKITSQAV